MKGYQFTHTLQQKFHNLVTKLEGSSVVLVALHAATI